jgi:hypothetical protein
MRGGSEQPQHAGTERGLRDLGRHSALSDAFSSLASRSGVGAAAALAAAALAAASFLSGWHSASRPTRQRRREPSATSHFVSWERGAGGVKFLKSRRPREGIDAQLQVFASFVVQGGI